MVKSSIKNGDYDFFVSKYLVFFRCFASRNAKSSHISISGMDYAKKNASSYQKGDLQPKCKLNSEQG